MMPPQTGTMTMKNLSRISSFLTLALLAGGLAGCAPEQQRAARLGAQAKITRAEAEIIALAKVSGGAVKECEIEKEHGRVVWSFDLATPGTADLTEVLVDANTGAVVAIEKETPEQQKKEKQDKD
jgi:uncharacterized membrane protein YkoI